MNLRAQRRIAAEILKVGKNCVKINPDREDDVSMAITRSDIRTLVHEKGITARYEQGVSRARARVLHEKKKRGKRQGPGSRKGKKTTYNPRKRAWIQRIRPQRKYLRRLRARRIITITNYRKLYRWASSGMFRNVAHLEFFIKDKKLTRR
ncbi:MAG TPA: 50S ribosomal protein L19e [Candidatus Deferrimicrobium sp.]|nr:50S ribosomal protein L19e [Candidatus Deferrimicrobium sp.]